MEEAHQACQLTSEWIKNLRNVIGVNGGETLLSSRTMSPALAGGRQEPVCQHRKRERC